MNDYEGRSTINELVGEWKIATQQSTTRQAMTTERPKKITNRCHNKTWLAKWSIYIRDKLGDRV